MRTKFCFYFCQCLQVQFLSGAVQVANFVLFVALIPKDVKTKVLPEVIVLLVRALLCAAVPW